MLVQETCTKCGGKVVRRGFDAGYATASELGRLGRLAGAKGRDEFLVLDCCEVCGGLDYEDRLVPCHICGSETPDQEINCCDRSGEITGICDWVPGLPNSVNICAGCASALDAEIERLVSEAIDEGRYE